MKNSKRPKTNLKSESNVALKETPWENSEVVASNKDTISQSKNIKEDLIKSTDSVAPFLDEETSNIIEKLLKEQDEKVIDELMANVRQALTESHPPKIEEVKPKVATMRVALLSWESLHSIGVGGIAAHVTELACALERKGHEVHVFTRMGFPGHANYELVDGVHYHRVGYHGHHDFIEDINNMCRAFVHAVFNVEDYMGAGFDIVHAHDWLASNAMVWIKQGRGRKTVMTMHSTEYGRCGNNFYGGPSSRIRDHERHGTFCADRIIAVSGVLKGEVMWMYNCPDWKVHVVYNGVDFHHYDGDIDAGSVKMRHHIGPMDPMVLFAGRMTEQKGPDILVEAIPHVLKFYPNAKFVFAGEGNLKHSCINRANQLGIGHACRFLGHQNKWALRELFKSCECVCVPSRNEPFGIVILEAWSAGKPVVATNIGGPSEFVWHDVTGFRIDPNPNSVAWGIGSLFANFEHARWMGEKGCNAAKQDFSWDVIADRTIGVYKSF